MLPATTRHLPRAVLGRAALAPAAVRGYATPAGPPPPGFRLRKPENWDQMEHKETIMDRASNYFLMTEMMRGMYHLMEQFFRPPYVIPEALMGGMRTGMRTR